MSGLFYTLPYATFGLVAGKVSDKVDRKLFLGIVVIAASLIQGVAGFTSSFSVFVLMRILHGAMNSATNPLSFSLVADYFPASKRTTANSIIQAGNYVGVAAGSMTILLVSSFGWKKAYGIMALVGSLFGLATWAFIKEPERGQFLTAAEKNKEMAKKEELAKIEAMKQKVNPIRGFLDSMKVVLSLPCAKNVLIASSLRNVGG